MALSSILLVLSAGVVLAGPALGQTAGDVPRHSDADAWLGCWDFSGEEVDATRMVLGRSQSLCLEPGPSPQVLNRSWIVDGRVSSVQPLRIDGSNARLSEGGCEGWERAQPSQDGRRLYLEAETACDGGGTRHMSGVWILESPQCWLDIQVVQVANVLDVTVERRRAARSSKEWSFVGIPMTVRAECLDTAPSLTVADVLEALDHVDPVVVEAMLFETRPSFAMRSSLLIELSEKGVPEPVIDLMVALSFPDYFEIVGNTIRLAPEPEIGPQYYHWYSDYGFFHSHYHYGYWYPRPPAHYPRGAGAINGLGYTRLRRTALPSSGFASAMQGSAAGGASGSTTTSSAAGAASPSGHTSSSTSARMAARRDDF